MMQAPVEVLLLKLVATVMRFHTILVSYRIRVVGGRMCHSANALGVSKTHLDIIQALSLGVEAQSYNLVMELSGMADSPKEKLLTHLN